MRAALFRPFLQFVYTPPLSLYEVFRRFPIIFRPSKQTYIGVVMDIVYVGLIAVFFIAICGFVVACDSLGARK